LVFYVRGERTATNESNDTAGWNEQRPSAVRFRGSWNGLLRRL